MSELGDRVISYCKGDIAATYQLKEAMKMHIKNVIYNPPATIVFWQDGSKTVVKCKSSEEYQPHVGLAMCIAKKTYGDSFHKVFKKWVPKEEKAAETDWCSKCMYGYETSEQREYPCHKCIGLSHTRDGQPSKFTPIPDDKTTPANPSNYASKDANSNA